MAKKVDVSFMKFVASDDDWKREIIDGGNVLCSTLPPRQRQQMLCDSLDEQRDCRAHVLLCAALAVVDVYSNIWGPCEMLAGHFSNYFFDFGETYSMKFVRACADKITPLKEYLGSSQPIFKFFVVRRSLPACTPSVPLRSLARSSR